jgi:hypothetical protein
MDKVYAKNLRDMVWEVREYLGDNWPTPNTEDSLAYAVTEVGEAIDADLRSRRPDDKRNNNRNVSVEHELAQAAMMLLTALGPEWEPEGVDALDWSLSIIAVKTTDAYHLKLCNWGTYNHFAEASLSAIDIYCVGVDRYLEQVLDDAKEKWG